MHDSKKEEFLSIFGVSLAMIACAAMIYLARVPSITGNAVVNARTTDVAIITILILAGLTLVLGAIVVIHKLKKEMESHKKVIAERPPEGAELTYYIAKAKENGFTDSQIISRLTRQGWSEKEIKKYLK